MERSSFFWLAMWMGGGVTVNLIPPYHFTFRMWVINILYYLQQVGARLNQGSSSLRNVTTPPPHSNEEVKSTVIKMKKRNWSDQNFVFGISHRPAHHSIRCQAKPWMIFDVCRVEVLLYLKKKVYTSSDCPWTWGSVIVTSTPFFLPPSCALLRRRRKRYNNKS